MKEIQHLTKNQIAGYRTGAFNSIERHEIGKHLLKCEDCRRSLPAPTFDDFWKAVVTERETEKISASEKSELSRNRFLSFFPILFRQFNGLAWSSAALAVLVSFSLFYWLNVGRQLNQEKEIAQTFNSNTNEFNPASRLDTTESDDHVMAPAQISKAGKPIFLSDSNQQRNPKSSHVNVQQRELNFSLKESISGNSAKQIPADKRNNISTTRGVVLPANCGNETLVETDIESSNDAITLKWKKIPKAVKYHLYVSDDEEILVDEFESERDTSYALKKPLAPQKTYQWKVVVTLKDGKTIINDSRKFTVQSLQSSKKKSERREKSVIRCSGSKFNR